MIYTQFRYGLIDITMVINGVLAGLVSITAGCNVVDANSAIFIGLVAGVLVDVAVQVIDKMKIDDPVGAISVHGVVGLLGLLLVPFTNDAASFSGQLIGAATIFVWVFGASYIVWSILKAIMGIRVSEEEEFEGVDVSECGMEAYPEFTSSKS